MTIYLSRIKVLSIALPFLVGQTGRTLDLPFRVKAL